MPTIQKKKLQIDSVTLAYEEYGEGHPIVFLHGIGSSSHSWRQVAQSLASSYRAVCFDLLHNGRRLVGNIPNARLEVIDSCGHCPQEEYPDHIALLIGRKHQCIYTV